MPPRRIPSQSSLAPSRAPTPEDEDVSQSSRIDLSLPTLLSRPRFSILWMSFSNMYAPRPRILFKVRPLSLQGINVQDILKLKVVAVSS